MKNTKKMGLASLVGSALMLPAVATADPVNLSIEYGDSEIVDPLDFIFSDLDDASGDVNLTLEARGDLGDGYRWSCSYNHGCYSYTTDYGSGRGNTYEYIDVLIDGNSQGLWLDGIVANDSIEGSDYGQWNYHHIGSMVLGAESFNSFISGDDEFRVTYDYSPYVNLNYSIDWARVTLQYDSIAAVPEPGTLFLLGGGLLGMGYGRRKKKSLG